MSRTAIAKLAAISTQPTRRIIGLMSGTSLDGLDIACCDITGSGAATRVKLINFTTIPYPDDVKAGIRKVFAQRIGDIQRLCLLNPWLAKIHAHYILDALNTWNLTPADIHLIASHGQTIFHAPRSLHNIEDAPNATLQIGDGDHLAVTTGIITLSDFRQKHIAAGGEGAPLALYGDYLIFSKKDKPRLMLNMGGIANFTFLPGTNNPHDVYVTDTGPGNTLIDAAARHYFQKEYDKDAEFAKQGTVSPPLLRALKSDEFFSAPFPKTTGPELFSLDYVERAQKASDTTGLSPVDLVATLTRFSAETITDAIRSVWPNPNGKIYMSGGGAHNPLLTDWIKEGLNSVPLFHTEELGIPGDAKEAVLFAILANETVAGEPVDFGRPGMPAITMGKISFP
ncbi:MAG TPA: anhydro-N-acetylmuramic acid kinase [Puia sp.]|uniref:anhydro-N-acetylmuramic acid kinase n=1 Tax=Puia sp. TaxID=2045100 RepID=UPI002CCD675A|nr:anhydro-N-acetylmuramic acid kinase [Puia sp.]HVU98377.1 anhydro-N-acetylmuramic acid kinase [Puia sp.]